MKPAAKLLVFTYVLMTALVLTSCSGVKSASSGTGSGSGSGGFGPGSGSGSGTGSGSGSGTVTPTGPFTIGGTVLGLQGTGLVLEDNGGDDLAVAGTGTVAFTFKTALAGGTNYNVIVKTQPSSPTQTCSVTSGTGAATANVTNIQVVCAPIFTVGGSVSGLLGTGLTLQDNAGDNLVVSGTGNVNFTFATPLLSGATYAVTVLTQPKAPVQTCTVMNGGGTISGNVTNVNVVCSQPGFSVGGSVVGLITGPGDTMELQNNAGDNLLVTGDTTFTFATPVTNGGLYNVSVFLPPTSQTESCTPFFFTGIANGNVSNVIIDCQHNDWGWLSWQLTETSKANNFAVVTTPLKTPTTLRIPSIGEPGGRDFAVTWNDNAGRRWLFGGKGWPYKITLPPNVIPDNLLNDLWVWDGEWIPANLPMFQDASGGLGRGSYPAESAKRPGLLQHTGHRHPERHCPRLSLGWLDLDRFRRQSVDVWRTRIRFLAIAK